MDSIQTVYARGSNNKNKAGFRWAKLLHAWQVFYERKTTKTPTQGGVGILQWAYPNWFSHTSYRPQSREQSDREPRVKDTTSSFVGTLDTREKGVGKKARRQNTTINKNMARLLGGERMASETRRSRMAFTKRCREVLQSLSWFLYNQTFRYIKILWAKLQDESTSKTIKRITRRRCAVVYNLEVDDTHSLIANGVVAHNCLDALRYAINSLVPVMRKREMAMHNPMPYYRTKERNPAR
jgi:hypothetical protein